jgi:hypothetical protein
MPARELAQGLRGDRTAWLIVALFAGLSFRRHTRNREALRMVLYAFVDGLGYRQMLAWWRLRAFFDLVRGDEGWGTIVRHGAGGAQTASERPLG